MKPGPGQVTGLLKRWQAGDREAEAQLFELVMPDLRRLARYSMRNERPGHILQPTALINEVYIRLAGHQPEWRDRRHFFAYIARAMRHYLMDVGRRESAKVKFVPLDGLPELPRPVSKLKLAELIDQLLLDLEKEDAEACSIVELKVFLGLTDEDAAEVLHLSLRTFQRRWLAARRWLYKRLESKP